MAEVSQLGTRCGGCHRDNPPHPLQTNGMVFCDALCEQAHASACAAERNVQLHVNLIHAKNPNYHLNREEFFSYEER